MTGNTYILGVILLIVGVFCIFILRKWNEKGLSSRDKNILKTIRDKHTNNWNWFVIALIINIPTLFSRETEFIGSNITWALGICIFAVFFVFQEQKTRRELLFAGVSKSYYKTNEFIENSLTLLLVVVGIIFLFS